MPLAFFVETPFLTTPDLELEAELSTITGASDDAALEDVKATDEELSVGIDEEDDDTARGGVSTVFSAIMRGLSVST